MSIRAITRTLGRRGSQEDGVVLVIVAILMTVFMASAALAIDLGSFYQAQRQAQTAADAGALAAAQDLSNSTVAAAAGTTYATTNFPGSTVTVATPYDGSSQRVKVTVTATTPAFFGQFLGLTNANVSASAVAGGTGTTVREAIFAYDSTCSGAGVALNGNAMIINGAIISNGSLSDRGNPSSQYGPATYGGPNQCSFTHTGSGSFASGPTATTTLTPYPLDFRNNPPACTFSAQSFTWSSDNDTIPSGVYCATGTITLSGNNLLGTNVTFIAPNLVVSAQNSSFTAPSDTNLVFWATGTSTLDISPNSITIGGTIFAPTASVVIDGNAGGTDFIEANDVTINGNSSFTGSGPVTSTGSIGLVQ